MNPLLQGHSGATPEASRNPLSTSQGTNEDDSQIDSHPEAGLFHSQITQNCGPEEDHDMLTGVQRDSMYRHDMTGDHEEVTYCSPSTSSGKQKKSRSTSQPQFRSKNTPATIEADQTLLALQQLANNNNSANFHNNINRICLFHSQITQNSGPGEDHDSDRLSPYVLQFLHSVEKLERQKGNWMRKTPTRQNKQPSQSMTEHRRILNSTKIFQSEEAVRTITRKKKNFCIHVNGAGRSEFQRHKLSPERKLNLPAKFS